MAAGMHYRTRYKSDLSPRQREVLDLVAKGYTNGQIAERLGLTLDGAKWHVSEILSKLDVDTREEAGRYWRAEHSLPRRLARAMPGFGWLGLRPLLIAAGAAVAVVAGVAIYIAIQATNTSRNAADAVPPTTQATIPATATPPPFDYGTAVEAPTFQSVDMVSTDVGWAISNTPSGGSVLRTADGGGHWRNVSPPGVASASAASPISSGFFLDSEHGWFAVEEFPPGGGATSATVWRTDDGGRSWTHGEAIGGGARGTLSFTNADAGWYLESLGAGAGSEGVAIYRTTDGGTHWTKTTVTSNSGSSGLPLSCTKSGIVFTDENHGWVTGQCMGGAPFFYATGDGGTTWTQVSLPDPADPAQPLIQCQCAFDPPRFTTPNDGFMAASVPDAGGDGKYVYTTADGGKTWKVAGGAPVQNALAVYGFANPTHWFAATNGSNTLYGTSDGGKTWSVIANPRQ
ncbi:hypothetical protein J0H33_10140, partial [bacterium]|nr:hypothetical protein [bacterium]